MIMLIFQGILVIGGFYLLGTVFKKYSPKLLSFMNKNKKQSIYGMFGIMIIALVVLIILRLNFANDDYGKVSNVAQDIYREVKVENSKRYKTKTHRQVQLEKLSRELKKKDVLADSSKLREIQLKFKKLKDEKKED